jgi:CsoR family transcriptional regulator, copper-sensing transcriptional repressor
MLTEKQKTNITSRLKRISGQVNGIQRMIDEDRYCMDIVTQVAAIVAALHTVEDMVLENHLNTCVADAVRSGNPVEQQEKVGEVMTVIGKLRKRG